LRQMTRDSMSCWTLLMSAFCCLDRGIQTSTNNVTFAAFTMAAATGKLRRPCLATFGSLQTRNRQHFHSWSKCASSAKLHVHTTASDNKRPIPPRRGNVGKAELPRPAKPAATKGVQRQNRRQALEARGVSVIYQQSATAMYRRKKGEPEPDPNPVAGFPRSVAATSGGSVVVRGLSSM